MNGITVNLVNKRFGAVQALKDVSLDFSENKIYGLLGRNGAGKTTLLNIISNRIFADSGEVLIDGMPNCENEKALKRIYLMSEKHLYPEGLKAADILRWSNQFYPEFDMNYSRELAEEFGLDLRKKVKSLSTGYSSILKNVVALSVNTPYVLMDEPVLGLDANHRDLLYKKLVERYAQKPATYIISTHLIEEVARVIEEVVIIKDGEIIKNESCQELVAGGYTVTGSSALVDSFIADKQVLGIDSLGGLKSAHVLGELNKAEVPPGLEITRLDLQKLFIKLTS